MALRQVDPELCQDSDDFTMYETATPSESVATGVLDGDDSTAYTATTPPETVTANLSLLVPWPGSTFMIRSVESGQVITLLDGKIVLDEPGSHGSSYWKCVETKGWLGFLNVVSGGYLGHDANGRLCCSVKHHKGWERFCFRARPEGGCILLMTHYDGLWHVGMKVEQEVEKLAKIGEGGSDGIVWEFVKV